MARINVLVVFLAIFAIIVGSTFAADNNWNIMKQKKKTGSLQNGLQISLKNFCEAWRINVELHNIKSFEVVPEECVEYIGKYMTSTQYKVDSERTIDECTVYLSSSYNLGKDGNDAWIFDIDDTLLSIVPYFKKNGFGGKKLNKTDLEEWMRHGKAPALEHSLQFFKILKGLGVHIFLVSSRRESLRSATVDNLVDQGYFGWSSLILRADDDTQSVEKYNSEVRKKLINKGYRILGILGHQWSSIKGLPSANRSFKLPNSLYYVS